MHALVIESGLTMHTHTQTRARCSHFSPQPVAWALSASVGSLVIVAIVVVRIFLGWQYVGDRLMSAVSGCAALLEIGIRIGIEMKE